MMSTFIGLALPTVLALAFYFCLTTYLSWRRLSHVPGPRGAALSKWWMLRNTMGGNMHLVLKKACADHGPLARIGPNTLVTNDPELLKRMWAVRSPYKKAEFYDAVKFDPSKQNILSMRDDDMHGALRAKMAAGYSGRDNDSLEKGVDRNIQSFVDLIQQKYLSKGSTFIPMDFAQKTQYLTLDVITELAFGKPFGYMAQDTDVYDYIKMTEDSMPVMMVLTILPTVTRLVQSPLMRGLLPSEHDKVGFGRFIGVAKQVVGDRLASKDPYRKDMLGSFLRNGLTRDEAEGEALVQVIAGSDTTATGIRTTMLHILSTPHVYAKLTAEIRDADSSHRISSPITDAEAKQSMPYLQAVIREGLRIFPPVAGLMPTLVPKGGEVIHGMHIPEGTEIGASVFGVQTNKDVYGEDAELFRPERWIEAAEEPERLKAMLGTWELIFKYGKWQCLGQKLALIELNKVFVELLRRYDFTLANPTQPWNSFSAGIFIQSDLLVKIAEI